MTLTEFLHARIAEDEEAALKLRGTGFQRWERVEYERSVGGFIPNIWEDWRPHPPEGGDSRGLGYVPLSDHIARHDPARVLADCEAKRQIIAEHSAKPRRSWFECAVCFDPDGGPGDYDFMTWPCPTLRYLALPHADHPDYDEAWRP